MNKTPKTALVTGAAAIRGIGAATARLLTERGFQVVIGGRNPEKLAEAAAALAKEGASVGTVDLDVTSAHSIAEAVQTVGERHGWLNVLINNAAVLLDHYQQASATTDDVLEKTLRTNVIGAHAVIRGFLPLLEKSGDARVVNVSSGGGQLVDMMDSVWAPAYQVSKSALNALTRLWAAELRPKNIAVYAVCPGWCRTEMGGENATRSAEEGASSVGWAALEANADQSGGFFRDGKPLEW